MRRRYLMIGGLLLAVACVLAGTVFWLKTHPAETAETRAQLAVAEHSEASVPGTEAPSRQQPAGSSAQQSDPSEDSATAPVYVSPVDFDDLWEMNPEIYAWLYIPGAGVNYPILQREGADEFYLNHDSTGRSSKAGAIFTQATYTSKDFSDPVTVVYGHKMRSGLFFGNLQSTYSAENGIEENRDVVVYLPDEEIHYQVFAAVPHNMRHLLYNRDYTDPKVFEAFLEQTLSVRSINASIDEETEVKAGDQLLILSTCLQGDSKQRYLVLAKRVTGSDAP